MLFPEELFDCGDLSWFHFLGENLKSWILYTHRSTRVKEQKKCISHFIKCIRQACFNKFTNILNYGRLWQLMFFCYSARCGTINSLQVFHFRGTAHICISCDFGMQKLGRSHVPSHPSYTCHQVGVAWIKSTSLVHFPESRFLKDSSPGIINQPRSELHWGKYLGCINSDTQVPLDFKSWCGRAIPPTLQIY